jgi:hypothetical protein
VHVAEPVEPLVDGVNDGSVSNRDERVEIAECVRVPTTGRTPKPRADHRLVALEQAHRPTQPLVAIALALDKAFNDPHPPIIAAAAMSATE